MKKYLIPGLLLTAAALLLVESKRVGGQDNPNPPAKPLVTRTYEIADLIFVAEDHPLNGDFVPLPGINQTASNQNQPSLFNNQQQPQQPQAWQERAARFDEVKKFITDNVDTTTWKDNGGDIGSISSSPLRASMIITTTAENQKAIQDRLDDLRRGIHIMRIRADWLTLSPGQIEKLQKNGPDDTAVLPEISRDLLRALPETTVHYSGSIVCFNGQTVHITSGRAKTVVTTLTPVVAPYSVAMDPTVSKIHEGIALEVTPTLAGDSAIVDLLSIITEPNRSVIPPTTQSTMQALEHIDSLLQDFRTTVRVPLNKPILIGGSTADPNPDHPAGRQLYLVIQVDAER
jgi:hypothetical protein